MIDLHSHILPGVDDGSRTYEESKNLLLEAKEVGFNKIISTSHYAPECFEFPEYKREKLISDLNTENNIPEIFLGSEIFINYNIIDQLSEFKASTINKTNYILVELPLHSRFYNLKDTLNKLKENDYKIIIAHPERYNLVQKDFNFLYELKDCGEIFFQCNFCSILGFYGRKAKKVVKKMLKNNMVDFLGSDVHRENSVYPRIPKAIEKIKKITSDEYFNTITNTNAEKILNGEIL